MSRRPFYAIMSFTLLLILFMKWAAAAPPLSVEWPAGDEAARALMTVFCWGWLLGGLPLVLFVRHSYVN